MAVREIIRNKEYKIEVAIGYNGDKRIRHYETFYGGKKDAIIRENEIKASVKNNTYIRKNKLTVADLFNEWLVFKEKSVAIKTYTTYKLYSKNIINSLGHIRLTNLTTKILEEFYLELKTKTSFADKTIKAHYEIISGALNCAVKWGYLLVNPNVNVAPIKVRKKEIVFYTPDELKMFMQALNKESIRNQAIILLTLASGCRRGEITGLTWEDIDFVKCAIDISKITQYTPGYGTYEKETKTESSTRKAFIGKNTIEILKKHKIEEEKKKLLLGNKWEGSNRIFTTRYGDDMHPNTPSKILDSVIKRNGLKRITFHGLRHTYATQLIYNDVQPQIISKSLGHSSLSITHNVYSHFFEEEYQEVANVMNKVLYNN
ncbi:MAG: site-specific integrase [Clostridia bacterium]|nr:site-specific integrase [Clostridia bacterium]